MAARQGGKPACCAPSLGFGVILLRWSIKASGTLRRVPWEPSGLGTGVTWLLSNRDAAGLFKVKCRWETGGYGQPLPRHIPERGHRPLQNADPGARLPGF